MHVIFDESNSSSAEKVVDDDVDEELQENSSNDIKKNIPPGNQDEQHEEINVEPKESTYQTLSKEWSYVSFHPKNLILGDPSRGSLRNTCEHAAFISQIKPEPFADAENRS